MTVEHLHALLDHCGDFRMFFAVAELFARGQVPESIQAAVKLGRMTALGKPEGGVRNRGRRCGASIGGQNDVAAIDGGCAVDHISFSVRHDHESRMRMHLPRVARFDRDEPQRNNSLRGRIDV